MVLNGLALNEEEAPPLHGSPAAGAARPVPERSELEARDLLRGLIRRARPGLEALDVVFHRNATTMVSKCQRRRQAVLRLHRIFLSAPPEVLQAVVTCFFTRLRTPQVRAVRMRIKDYIQVQHVQVLLPTPPDRVLPPRGRVFDLAEVLERVSTRWFNNNSEVEIAWSRRVLKRLMGKWVEHPKPLRNLILINRLLDSPEVPDYYLEFLVFHELLHETIPAHRSCGKWVHHSPEFRAREREYPDYRRALRWEKQNIDRLYRKHRSR